MLCSELMKSAIECVSPEDSADLAARRMRDHNVGFLPVCDENLRVVGTLTDRDLVIRLLAEQRPATTPVADLMTREVVACRTTDDLHRAEELMGLHRVARILCTDEDGTLVGLISLSDVAEHESATRAGQTLKDVTLRERHP
jgi:CBS domain-containing protein